MCANDFQIIDEFLFVQFMHTPLYKIDFKFWNTLHNPIHLQCPTLIECKHHLIQWKFIASFLKVISGYGLQKTFIKLTFISDIHKENEYGARDQLMMDRHTQRRPFFQILYSSLLRILSWIRTHDQLNTVRRRDPVVSLQQAGQLLLLFVICVIERDCIIRKLSMVTSIGW